MSTGSINPLILRRELERRYRSYYDSACAFADRSLMAERARLLDGNELSAEALIEPLPGFRRRASTSRTSLNVSGSAMTSPSSSRPSWRATSCTPTRRRRCDAYERGEHVVITAGTGSGRPRRSSCPSSLTSYASRAPGPARRARRQAWWEGASRVRGPARAVRSAGAGVRGRWCSTR